MTKRERPDQRFHDFLEGKSSEASPELDRLAKLAEALRPPAQAAPSTQFKARLRSTLLAHASMSEEDSFAAALEGVLLEAPAEVKPLVAVASALEPATLPAPSPSFRYQLRHRLIAEASRRPLHERIAASVAATNARMRRSFRLVMATGAMSALLFGSSLALAMSEGAVPGDALYPLERWHEQVALAPLSGEAEGRRYLAYARERIDEIEILTQRGVEDVTLYADAFQLMDDQTTLGATLLLQTFEVTGERALLEDVAAFAIGQAGRIQRLIPSLPAGARPAARDSLVHVEETALGIQNVLGECACPTGGLFVPTATVTGAAECVCEPRPVGDDGDAPDDGGSTPPDGQMGPDPDQDPEPPTDDDASVDLPDDLPDDVEDPVEDIVDDLINDLDDAGDGLTGQVEDQTDQVGDLVP